MFSAKFTKEKNCSFLFAFIDDILFQIGVCSERTEFALSKQISGPSCSKHHCLTSSLRGHLVKCFMILLLNTQIFLLKKIREAFALQKFLTFFQQKILEYF